MSDPLAYDFEDAFHGPLGEYARRNQVRVEIDNLSLLLQLLTVAGNAMGRRVFAYGGPDRHYPILYTLIVGRTGIGKGGSGTVANELGEAIDPGFTKRTALNVASGPVLIEMVTDGFKKIKRKKTRGVEREEIEVVREPVQDKRLLLYLPEFGSTLVAQGRNGSTLRDELKNAWDGRTLENNKYGCQERATDPHIGMIGHITPADLKIGSSRRDVGNGYLNRFLITQARCAQTLPFHVPAPDCNDLLDHLRGVLERLGPVNHGARCFDWAEDARNEWAAFYAACKKSCHPLIADDPELAARLPASVMRVALIYAALDEAPAIQLQHLRAGKALCLEALDRNRHLFTDKPTGNADSDLVQKLRTVFADRKDRWIATDLHKETGGRFSGDALTTAAANLVASGEWCVEEGKHGNGHPGNFWWWAIDAETKVEDAPIASPPDDEIEEPMPAGTVIVEGIRLQHGAHITIRHDATALEFSGSVTGVCQGQKGHLAAISPYTSDAAQSEAQARLAQRPHHFCVIIEGRVLFVPKKAVATLSIAEAVPA